MVAWVKIDDFQNPFSELKSEHHILSSSQSDILVIPKGYANGLKALESDSELMVFSDLTLEESARDNIRFESSLWMDWSKFNRI